MLAQDILAFIWKYGSEQHDSTFFILNGFDTEIQTTDYVCDANIKNDLWFIDFGWFHDAISRYPIPFLTVIYSRLAEIGVRTTFFIMTSIATLLFDELDQGLNNLAEKSAQYDASSNRQKMSKYLDDWKFNYNLICEFTEQINQTFGVVLIIVCLIDYAVPIFEFANVLLYSGTNMQYNLQFIHLILRFLFILIASHRLGSKVILYSLFCF